MATSVAVTPVCSQCTHYYNPNGDRQGFCPMGFSRNEWGEEEEFKRVEPYQDSSGCRWYTELHPF